MATFTTERGGRWLEVVEYLEVAKALRIDPFALLHQLTTGTQGRSAR